MRVDKVNYADYLLILTGEEYLAIDYGKPTQKNLTYVTVENLDEYIRQGQFPEGSMLPKVQAAEGFVLWRRDGVAVIGALHKLREILNGKSGTRIGR